jgi:polar amino acid transport system substrate-binding protein
MPGPSRRQFLLTAASGLAASALPPTIARPASVQALRLAFFDHFQPLSFVDDRQEVTGILPEAVREVLERRIGMPTHALGLPWPRAQAAVRDGKAEVFCTNPTPERQEFARFSRHPLVLSSVELFYAADNPRRAEIEAVRTIGQLQGFRQGDYRGNAFAMETFKDLPILFKPTLDIVLRMIAVKHLDIFVGNNFAAEGSVKRLGLTGQILCFPVDIGRPSHFHIGVRASLADAAELIGRIDRATAEVVADGTVRRIVDRFRAA